MPDDSKKQHKSNKNDPKEQRKPRRQQARHEAAGEKKTERKPDEPRAPPHQPAKPVYEDPGPEFYKNLKRETDEILKITEEANSKYKKKEIQSNWTKYEMPIESYEEMDEQENLGADYEKLIGAPMSIGGHFQFKHEKSWDISTGPSLYDRYFDINTNNLALAISTIPFYERNNIDETLFSKTDILNMNNRSTRFKQKYYNDKSYTTPELEAEDKILNSIKESMSISEEKQSSEDENETVETKRSVSESKDIVFEESTKSTSTDIPNTQNKIDDLNLSQSDNKNIDVDDLELKKVDVSKCEETKDITAEKQRKDSLSMESSISESKLDDIDDIILQNIEVKSSPERKNKPEIKKFEESNNATLCSVAVAETKKKPSTNPVMESPEDLEKWLDDFLDD